MSPMTNEVFKDYIERKKNKLGDEFCVMLERAGRDNGESSEEWTEKLENFLSDMAKEIFGALPEEATERTSAKIREDYAMSYDECLSWNACRKAFLENIKKLK